MQTEAETIYKEPIFMVQAVDKARIIDGDPFKSGGEIPLDVGERLIILYPSEWWHLYTGGLRC